MTPSDPIQLSKVSVPADSGQSPIPTPKHKRGFWSNLSSGQKASLLSLALVAAFALPLSVWSSRQSVENRSRASQPATPVTPIYPIPENNPIHWASDSFALSASNFYIKLPSGQILTANPNQVQIHVDTFEDLPNRVNFDVYWYEEGVSYRFYINLDKNDTHWWADYIGYQTTGNHNFFGANVKDPISPTPHGQEFQVDSFNVTMEEHYPNSFSILYFKDLTIQAYQHKFYPDVDKDSDVDFIDFSLHIDKQYLNIYNFTKILNTFGRSILPAPTPTPTPHPTFTQVTPEPYNLLPELTWKAITTDPEITYGDSQAPVTIVEFTDYQCPFCANHHNGAFKKIKSQYIDSGKVYYIIRDFPLSNHSNAVAAANAVYCSTDRLSMIDTLFNSQSEWSHLADTLAMFTDFAENTGTNPYEFEACQDTLDYQSTIQGNTVLGHDAQVKGTPTLIINRETIAGAKSIVTYSQIIDKYLDEIEPPIIIDDPIE